MYTFMFKKKKFCGLMYGLFFTSLAYKILFMRSLWVSPQSYYIIGLSCLCRWLFISLRLFILFHEDVISPQSKVAFWDLHQFIIWWWSWMCCWHLTWKYKSITCGSTFSGRHIGGCYEVWLKKLILYESLYLASLFWVEVYS